MTAPSPEPRPSPEPLPPASPDGTPIEIIDLPPNQPTRGIPVDKPLPS